MKKQQLVHKVVFDKKYKYRHLYPIPNRKQLADFYKNDYFKLVKSGFHGENMARLIKNEDYAEKEREWMRSTIYEDIKDIFTQLAPGRKIFDIGCGSGEFLSYMKENHFKAYGLEPSEEMKRVLESRGITTYCMTLERFVLSKKSLKQKFDAVTLLNVLEHVGNPLETIQNVKKILKPNGILCIKVPNDFNKLQRFATKKLKLRKWWVVAPDHINYFNEKSLCNLLKDSGFKVIYEQTDFPMELFLLFGENYIDNPLVGKACHAKRVNFELAIDKKTRRLIYSTLAKIGIGRECFIFCQLDTR